MAIAHGDYIGVRSVGTFLARDLLQYFKMRFAGASPQNLEHSSRLFADHPVDQRRNTLALDFGLAIVLAGMVLAGASVTLATRRRSVPVRVSVRRHRNR